MNLQKDNVESVFRFLKTEDFDKIFKFNENKLDEEHKINVTTYYLKLQEYKNTKVENFNFIEKHYPNELLTKNIIYSSIILGNMEVLIYSFNNNLITHEYANYCYMNNITTTEIFFIEDDKPLNVNTCLIASRYGQLECLKYLNEQGCPLDSYSILLAIKYDHLNCLKYLCENRCPLHPKTYFVATRYGRLNCLKYLVDFHSKFHLGHSLLHHTYCAIATKKGFVDILEYLHQKDCGFSQDLSLLAAKYGKLNTLKYTHDNGCIWNEDIVNEIVKRGHYHCLDYVMKNNNCWKKEKLLKLSKDKRITQYILNLK